VRAPAIEEPIELRETISQPDATHAARPRRVRAGGR
jgi:hypothetical protein